MARWCEANGLSQRPLVSLDQLWGLAQIWYAERLTVESPRPSLDEVVPIFARFGLTGPFWDPQSVTQ